MSTQIYTVTVQKKHGEQWVTWGTVEVEVPIMADKKEEVSLAYYEAKNYLFITDAAFGFPESTRMVAEEGHYEDLPPRGAKWKK
jgi:hypothetical protein